MKLQRSAFAAMVCVFLASSAGAQTVAPASRLVRADVQGMAGWLNANKDGLDRYDNWVNRIGVGGVTFGWYWTDNLKTEVEGSVSSRAEWYAYDEVVIDQQRSLLNSEFHFQNHNLAIGQQYQFYRNVWFHPFLAGGVDLAWEKIDQSDSPITFFDINTRQTRVLRPAFEHPTRTEVHARPFAAIGFKTYMTPRAFFRSDMKLVLGHGVDEVLFRFGVGVDF